MPSHDGNAALRINTRREFDVGNARSLRLATFCSWLPLEMVSRLEACVAREVPTNPNTTSSPPIVGIGSCMAERRASWRLRQSRGADATNGTLRLNRARWAEGHEQQARKERRRASQPILYPFVSGLRDRGAVELLTCMRRQPIDCGSVSARRESQTLPFHLRGIMQRPGSHNVFSAAVQFGQSCRGDRLP